MYKKICPDCKGDSYSASTKGEWICPYCDADLSDVASTHPGCESVTPNNAGVVLIPVNNSFNNEDFENDKQKPLEWGKY